VTGRRSNQLSYYP